MADLNAVHSLDSAGLGIIVTTYISAKTRGCDLMLVNVSPRIKDLLTITNLTSFLKGENAQTLPKTSNWS